VPRCLIIQQIKEITTSKERRIEMEMEIETILIMAIVVAAHLTISVCYQIVAAKS
jgi:hypothetical protein